MRISVPPKPAVAVLVHRLGPYHFARSRAAGQVLSTTAIEVAATDNTYAWDPLPGADGFKRVTLDRAGRRQLEDALAACNPDVVAVPGWSESWALAALIWSAVRNIPAVVMSESTAWDEKRVAWKEALKRRIVRLGASALVGGRPQAEYLVQLGMPASRIFLGYDAVDNDFFAAEAAAIRGQSSGVRERLALPQNYFLASARFVEKKNLPRLLQAYAQYRQLARERGAGSAAPWDLVILGDGEQRLKLSALCSALGTDAHVHLPGFKQYADLPAYYALAGAFIQASTTEPWGLVVNEAMASSLPVLVSNRCGCGPDLVQAGGNGYLFDPYAPETLAQLMLRLSNLPEAQRQALGAASRDIIAHWGPQRFASGLKAAVDCALAVGPRRASTFDRSLLRTLMAR